MEQHVDVVSVISEMKTYLVNQYQRPALLYAGGIGSLRAMCMIGGQQVFALCQRFPFISGCILQFGTGAFRVLSASINDPSNVAAGAVSVCCSRVVCMVCRLSIPSSGIYIRFFSLNVFCTLSYIFCDLSLESIFIGLCFRRLYFGLIHPAITNCIFKLDVK